MSSVLGVTEYAGKELEDAIDGVLVLRVPLTGGDSFFPEGVVGLLERREVGGNGLLVTLDGRHAVHDGIDVHKVARGDAREGVGVVGRIGHVDGRIFILAMGGLLLALDEAEEIWLTTVKVGVFEVPWFGISVALENALLQMRNFVKPVHVQLAHKGRKLLVLEPASKHLTSKLFMVEDWMGVDREDGGGDGGR